MHRKKVIVSLLSISGVPVNPAYKYKPNTTIAVNILSDIFSFFQCFFIITLCGFPHNYL